MTGPPEILEALHRLAQDARALAILWHGIAAAGLIALCFGWRPPRWAVAPALALPILSAGAAAAWQGNRFNGPALLGVGLLLASRRAPDGEEHAGLATGWTATPAVGLIAFSWAYPHFIDVNRPFDLFVAAPLGVVPCPSIALVLGLGLFFSSSLSRTWKTSAAIAGLAYGLFGWVVLGVRIDAVLVAGAGIVMADLLITPRRVNRRGLVKPPAVEEKGWLGGEWTPVRNSDPPNGLTENKQRECQTGDRADSSSRRGNPLKP